MAGCPPIKTQKFQMCPSQYKHQTILNIKTAPTTNRILGIDPGTNILGYAFIEANNRKMKLNNLGVIKLDKYENHYIKLQKIHEKISFLIESYEPTSMAIEAPFYGKNPQSMLKLGRAQGVSIAAAMTMGVEVTEYAPRKIKQSITGSGNASKEQVAGMLQRLLNMEKLPKYYDATDALGVAVCHYLQSSSIIQKAGKKYGSWKDFAKENPNKVK